MRGVGWIRRGWVAWVNTSRGFRIVVAIALLGPLVGVISILMSGPGAPHVPGMKGAAGVHTFKPKKVSEPPSAAPYRPGPVNWPATASGVATLTGGHAVAVAGTPVSVAPLAPRGGVYRGPASVAVRTADRPTAVKAGVNGLLLTLAPLRGGSGAAGSVQVDVNYSGFRSAYGGNFGAHLRLVELPACALTTPQLPACRTPRTLRGEGNFVRLNTVYGAIDFAGSSGPVVLAATSDGSPDPGDGGGPAGSYAATTLKPAGSWSAGGSAGSFTYSYPIPVPPAASALVPTVGLAYDSGSVDGQTVATQTQANWVGDGWSTPQNFIEQSFKSCKDSPEGSAAPQSTPDQCYDGPILTLSLGGTSTPLVWDTGSKSFKTANDNGDVITHVTNSGNGSGTYNTDYWNVTDRSGTVFSFGINELPGVKDPSASTNSVDSEPVFSAHSGDPCYKPTWADSVCTMAYRWNLDYVKDLHGNAMAYYYKQDTNAYAENGNTAKATTYVRDSHLDHIDYGFTDNGGSSGPAVPADQVVFGTGDRCVTGTCDPLNKTNAGNWPDVPYYLNCTAGASCQNTGPSFWSTVRLAGITTQQWNGTGWSPVDSWTFTQSIPNTGDNTSPTLWLSSITHKGSDTTAGGSAVTLPQVSFTTQMLANRVDSTTDGLPPLTRFRINTITTETGSVIGVNYELVNKCTAPVKIDPASNTASCYPVYWTPPLATGPLLDWFNKYQVASVSQSDPTGGAPAMFTWYKYLGGGAWHFDDNELVKAKYRTYGQWRGFGDVQTFTGTGTDAQTEQETTYYRGMSGQTSGDPAISVKDSQGNIHDDTYQLAGKTLESTTYNFAGGPVTGSTISSYWVSPPTASRTRSGLPPITANATGAVETWTRTAITDNSPATWRETETDTTFDTDPSSATFGMPKVVYAHGDLGSAGASQRSCAVTTYAPASSKLNLAGLLAEVEVDADPCGGSNPGGASAPSASETNALTPPSNVNRPADVISDQRTFYDNPALAQTWPQPTDAAWPQVVPSKGDISEVQVANGYSGGAFTYQVKSAALFDSYGRNVASFDPLGHETQTVYTMTNGVTTATKTSNPLGQVSSTTLDPLRALPTSTTDANGVTATLHYDGLGRLIAVWKANRPSTSPANDLFTYQVSATKATAVTSQVLNDSLAYATSNTLYDAMLRPRQAQAPTPQGGLLITDTFYDTRGWVVKKNNAWWDTSTPSGVALVTVPDAQVPNQDVMDLDRAGRTILDTSYDDSQVRSRIATAYTGDETITATLGPDGNVVPASQNGDGTATVTDALGRTSELDHYTSPATVVINRSAGTAPIASVAFSGGTTQATTYAYNNDGKLPTQIKDVTSGAVWTSTYDLLGQVTAKTDPDAGASTMSYDAAGNVLQTTDARSNTISYTYDALNRKTGEYAAPVSSQASTNQLASWAYDNGNGAVPNMTNPIGQLTTQTSYVGGSGAGGNAYTEQSQGFNVFGESLGTTVTIPSSEGALAGSYAFTHAYDATGLHYRDFYPASPGGALPQEFITYGFSTALDLTASLGGLSNYLLNATYTAFGQVAQQQIGQDPQHDTFITNTFDRHTAALTDSQTTNNHASTTPIQDVSYSYDPAGNPTHQTTTRQGAAAETQCFGYDGLDRLAQTWTATDSCAADPSTNHGATVGSGITGGTYWSSYTFNALGERATATDHGLSGAADTTTTYTYDGNGANQPHTLTSSATSGPSGTSTASYIYDADGNQTQRTTPGSGQQSLTWSATGQLTAVTTSSGGSSYIYDAAGQLLLQKDPGATTLYLPGEQFALNTTTGAVTGTRFCPLPGGGQVVRTGAGNNYTFQTADQHGTATLNLDTSFSTPTWRQETPYGAPRGTQPSNWPDNLGFLNKPQDTTTGLTNVGARWYDPSAGDFVSLDPVFQPTSIQQQNGYDYAGNNPITNSDPNGTWICNNGGTDSGGCGYRIPGQKQLGETSPNPANWQNYGRVPGEPAFNTPDQAAAQAAINAAIIQARIDLLDLEAKIAALDAQIKAQTQQCQSFPRWGTEVCGQGWPSISGIGHMILGGAGAIPGLGAFPDLLNGLWYNAEGDHIDAVVSVLAAIPFEGDAQDVALLGKQGGKLFQQAEAEAKALTAEESTLQKAEQVLCSTHSFAGATRVLMANGKSKPIDHVKVGDKVTNALPGAPLGTRDQANVVTAVHITYTDHVFTDITIATKAGPRTITGTANHSYWNATTQAWTQAGNLQVGQHVQTTTGHTESIVATHTHTATMATYDLTINNLHTYYVESASTALLVHNGGLCGPAAEKVQTVLERVTEKGSPFPGYKGGGVFGNTGVGGGEILPSLDSAGNTITYREWDVNPYTKGVNRGPERLVTGSDGSAYYTNDHYMTFDRIL